MNKDMQRLIDSDRKNLDMQRLIEKDQSNDGMSFGAGISPDWLNLDKSKTVNTEYKKGEEPWYEDFAEGMAVSGMETVYGLKDLAGLDTEADKIRLEDWKKDASQSGWGTGGRITGEMVQLAAPTGVAGGLLKGASKASKLAKAVNLAKSIAPAAIHGYVKLPEENGSRAWNAGMELGSGLMLAGAGKVLGKVASGVNKTRNARKLLKAGARLTPGQAAGEGTVTRLAEDIGSLLPLSARGTKTLRDRGISDWGKYAFNRVNPKGYPEITKAGHEGFNQLKNNIKMGYDDAWDGAKALSKDKADKVVHFIENATGEADDVVTLKRLLRDVGDIEDGMKKGQLTIFDRAIGKLIGKSKNRPFLQEDLQRIRRFIRSELPEENIKKLAYMDKTYPNYLAVRDAGHAAKQTKGEMIPSQLINAVSKNQGKTRSAGGADSMARRAYNEGVDVVGKRKEVPMLSAISNVMRGAPSPTGVMDFLRKGALGEYKLQSVPNEMKRSLLRKARRNNLDYLMNPVNIGAAIEE